MIVCDTSVCSSVVFVQNSTMATNQDDLLSLAHHNYDQAKELYAINVTGCSLLDILSTILISPILCVIYQNVCDLLFKSRVIFSPAPFTCSCTVRFQSHFSTSFTFYWKCFSSPFPCCLYALCGRSESTCTVDC